MLDCDKFWGGLANDEHCLNATLENLTIMGENKYFEGLGEESVVAINTLITRQGTTLKTLEMHRNELTDEQK